MNYQSIVSLLTVLISLPALPTLAQSTAKTTRPNILYLYVDDMGWGSIGPNGQAARKEKGLPYVRTPNLDRLAAEGVNFTRGYGCHVCSPARSSQQSGFHQGHTFADRNDPDNAKKAMRAEERLMGDVLSEAGYATGYWGKWGYGGSKDQHDPVIQNVQTLPTSHGYQHVLAELHHVRAHTFFQPTLWHAPASEGAVGGLELVPNSLADYQGKSDYPNEPALQNDRDYPETAYCDDSYAFAALDFVRRQGTRYNQTGQPFFGLLAVQIPHAPFGEIASLPEWDRMYADDPSFETLSDQTRQWAAMVSRIDAHFGNLLRALDDPNNDGDTSDSIAANTLVVFQSDNGGPKGKNHLELDANGGLRGTKGQIQEGGIRVPLVMRWPAKIHASSTLLAGSHCDRVVDVTDLLPTFAELAGAEVPLGVDGVSLAPTLRGTGHQRDREYIIHEAGNGTSIIRNQFKLVRVSGGRRPASARLSLYNLANDHAEENDIAADHPQLVRELETLLLGERVDEPRGFAVTYHHWIGGNDADTATAENWSDYVYSNAGKTYLTDRGTPRLSWLAHLNNRTQTPQRVTAHQDLEVLALEISGDPDSNATETLALTPSITLTGRNEIRIGPAGVLDVGQATVSTLRWVDIHPGGTLVGSGKVQGRIYNGGELKSAGMQLHGDYNQQGSGMLTAVLGDGRSPAFAVSGTAVLRGELAIATDRVFKPGSGQDYVVVSADRIEGTFSNADAGLQSTDGTEFEVIYTPGSVIVRERSATR